MVEKVTIAVDALGGDKSPDVVLAGVELALAEDEDLSVILCGPQEVVEPFSAVHNRCIAKVTTEQIFMMEHPAIAVRKKKDSSIVVGCRLVKENEAQGFFSAGSTGACLSAATLVMGRIGGISRPALAVVLPSSKGPVVLCDVGANADCKPEYLVQFAQMASVYCQRIIGVKIPRVGLLNIGTEEEKGTQLAQHAFMLMRDKVPGFVGNAEGSDVLKGSFDVVVCDGFSGNICLKTIEGSAKMLFGEIKNIMMSSLPTKFGALMLKNGLKGLAEKLNPDTTGGAPLLGCKGACIVGHGSSNSRAIKNGVLASAEYVRSRVSEIIAQTSW